LERISPEYTLYLVTKQSLALTSYTNTQPPW
jgi:hypothetical protein